MKHSENIAELAQALALAQAKIESAKKTSDNPYFKSKYADLNEVWNSCKIAITENSLSVVQVFGKEGEEVFVETVLMHKSGQWISSQLFIKPIKNDHQALGSALKYARRYSLEAILSIPSEDDDGEAAMSRGSDAVEDLINELNYIPMDKKQRIVSSKTETSEDVGKIKKVIAKEL